MISAKQAKVIADGYRMTLVEHEEKRINQFIIKASELGEFETSIYLSKFATKEQLEKIVEDMCSYGFSAKLFGNKLTLSWE